MCLQAMRYGSEPGEVKTKLLVALVVTKLFYGFHNQIDGKLCVGQDDINT